MNVFIVNTHSTLNSGDAGIVLAEVQFLKKYFKNIRIGLTSRTPEIDRALYCPMGIDVFPPITPAPSVFSKDGSKIRRSLGNLFNINAKKEILSRIKNSDFVISNGGGYFWTNRPVFPGPMFFQNYLHVKLAAILGKPTLFFPQSFGPFYNSVALKILRNVLQGDNVAKIFVREKTSFDLLTDLLGNSGDLQKMRVFPDMAFCLKKEDIECHGEVVIDLPEPRVALTLREWDFPAIKSRKERLKKRNAYLTALRKVCQKINRVHGASIVLFSQARGPGNFENDIPITKRFFDSLKSSIPQGNLLYIDLPASVSPLRIINILSRVDLIIATRFHSAIFALISGVPAISIGYQPKSKGAMDLLDLEDYCIDIAEVEAGKIFNMVEDILEDRDSISRMILKKVNQLRGEIEGNLKSCLRRFL